MAAERVRIVDLVIGPWWTFVVRGIFAILFGILTFFIPGMALLTLVYLFGAYALLDGVLNLAAAFRRAPVRPAPRWALVVAGVVSLLAGFIAFLMPGLTALSLLVLMAAWAIVRGIFEIVAAIALRKQITGEWLYVVGGGLSVAFGVLLFMFPGAGALAVVLWIGAYAIVFGALLLAAGLKLRRFTRVERRGPGIGEARTA